MPVYKAPLDDIRFVLNDVLQAEQLATLPGYEQATPDLIDPILDGAADICENVLFPLNQPADKQGCTLTGDVVTTPDGFKDAYRAFAEGGWTGISSDPNYGGMGLPHLMNFVLDELVCSSNMSFGMYPGLSKGAYDALHTLGHRRPKTNLSAQIGVGHMVRYHVFDRTALWHRPGIDPHRAVPDG
jgi:alkylation response protein AidB-like acyl-CoA dehydrogenase